MPRDHDWPIGRLARETGCKVQTIRYYEAIGLMPPPRRSAGNQRRYGPRDAARLSFIRHARQLGFSLPAIRQLLALADDPEQPCEQANAIAAARLAEVEQRIAALEALRTELRRMVRECACGRVAECRVIEILADHDLCLSEHPAEAPA